MVSVVWISAKVYQQFIQIIDLVISYASTNKILWLFVGISAGKQDGEKFKFLAEDDQLIL